MRLTDHEVRSALGSGNATKIAPVLDAIRTDPKVKAAAGRALAKERTQLAVSGVLGDRFDPLLRELGIERLTSV